MIETSKHFLRTERTEPVSIAFNAMVMTCANAALPRGWRVEESYVKAPSSLLELNASMNTAGMVVWGGGSDATIFGCPDHNAAFRAWHDSIHWKHQLQFTVAGEAQAAYLQVREMVALYGVDEDIELWAAYILCEVLGQKLHHELHGEFPQDQRAFFEANLSAWTRLGTALVGQIGEQLKLTSREVLTLAKASWGQ